MLTLQIGNPGNTGIMSCLGQGGLPSLSALVKYNIKGMEMKHTQLHINMLTLVTVFQ